MALSILTELRQLLSLIIKSIPVTTSFIDMDGLLLLVDFEKAFDSIEWNFLQKALNSFNFGPSIC